MKPNARNWTYFALSFAGLAACSAILFSAFPAYRGLLKLALYTIPSHMFISPFPHEPLLLYYAKSYPAIHCAFASLIGCLIAGVWDYWLFIPLMHDPRVRSKYAHAGLYKKSVVFFRKSPFWALVVVGLTPMPFYPVKFLSIGDRYPLKRYLLALTVGRTPRYWAIAYLGNKLQLPNWILVAAALAILVFTLVKSRLDKKKESTVETESRPLNRQASSVPPEVSAKSTPSGR